MAAGKIFLIFGLLALLITASKCQLDDEDDDAEKSLNNNSENEENDETVGKLV